MSVLHSPGRVSLSILGVMLALLGGMAPSAADLVIKLPATSGSIDLAALNEQQFSSGFRMGLAIDPESLGDDELKRAIDALPLTAPNGLPLRQRAFVARQRIGVGTSDPGIAPRISAVTSRDGQTELLVLFNDREGRYVVPDGKTIGVFDVTGLPLAHTTEMFSASKSHAYVDLLLDRSGSMENVIGEVIDAASGFMARLPNQAQCRVTSFNHESHRHSHGHIGCQPSLHGISGLGTSGGTDIYTPLRQAYLDPPPDPDALRLLVVVSDGLGRSATTREAVLAAKGNTTTFVYWLGDYDETRLDGIADTFIHGRADMDDVMGRYFGAINDALENQVVITIGGKEAKP